MVNIQPFKTTIKYPSTDSIFFILISLSYVAALGGEIASTEKYFYSTTMTAVIFSSFVPITYITFLISSWLFSRRRWFNMLIKIPRY